MAPNAFSLELKTQREAMGLSQSKLADLADLDHSYVSRLESGARQPTRDAVYSLSTALGATETETRALLLAAGYSPGGDHITIPQLADLQKALMKVDSKTRRQRALIIIEHLALMLEDL